MSMQHENATGLRERKKRATTNSIERAGVHLALEKGYENVTVAEICERADVSRSTFFNHMPTREAAMFGRPITLANEDAVEAALEDSRGVPITTALMRIIFLSIGHSLVNPEVAAARLKLAKEQPATELLIAAPITALIFELARFLAGWFERHPDRRTLPALTAAREAQYLVLLTGTAFRSMIADVSGTEDTVISEAAFESAIDEIVALASARNRHTTRIANPEHEREVIAQ